MSGTYDMTALQPHDTTSEAWALATLRFILRDTTAPFAFADAELTAALNARAAITSGATHYRPHTTAVALIRGDPHRALTERIDNASIQHRNATEITSGILNDYAWVDDLIEAATGTRPTTGKAVSVRW